MAADSSRYCGHGRVSFAKDAIKTHLHSLPEVLICAPLLENKPVAIFVLLIASAQITRNSSQRSGLKRSEPPQFPAASF